MKINSATGHDSYEAWRFGDHDDLVLATAFAMWEASVPPRPRFSTLKILRGVADEIDAREPSTQRR